MKRTVLPLAMRRNCNLELCLFPSGSRPLPDSGDESMTDGLTGNSSQQLTIFYNGRVCVSDVTEIQARAIICLASREADERINSTPRAESVSPSIQQSQLYSPPGLSMKRSLQRFLQTRKDRKQATSPYNQ